MRSVDEMGMFRTLPKSNDTNAKFTQEPTIRDLNARGCMRPPSLKAIFLPFFIPQKPIRQGRRIRRPGQARKRLQNKRFFYYFCPRNTLDFSKRKTSFSGIRRPDSDRIAVCRAFETVPKNQAVHRAARHPVMRGRDAEARHHFPMAVHDADEAIGQLFAGPK